MNSADVQGSQWETVKLGLEKTGEKPLRDQMFWSGDSAEFQRAEGLAQVIL